MRNCIILAGFAFVCVFAGGCIERELTVNTRPEGAKVVLNDEEIGISPVTVSFNWYGTYKVDITKKGYESINTSKKLKRPREDYFPFDLFADIFSKPGTVRSYTWDFELSAYQPPQRQEIINRADQMKTMAQDSIGDTSD
ncbi:PEGA domain protein [Limihaloglobus sulfuriphilus]|uniref:PEGA domain protein n=1 Tax=Limihaloglobus sulfuriphilus TaxID=1851148 RepID=A0A1Q2MAH2_9BACT|nr:PEGA domain-containing protein [Limihaloglobus sulfuriphilus]AQQ69723.1 PEGA domain protein [Limihaloglobus sulfuriphilus]